MPTVPGFHCVEGFLAVACLIQTVGLADLLVAYLTCDIDTAIENLLYTFDGRLVLVAVVVLEDVGIAVLPLAVKTACIVGKKPRHGHHVVGPLFCIGFIVVEVVSIVDINLHWVYRCWLGIIILVITTCYHTGCKGQCCSKHHCKLKNLFHCSFFSFIINVYISLISWRTTTGRLRRCGTRSHCCSCSN